MLVGWRTRDSPSDEITMLTFAAGLIRLFRFASIVTILQQVIRDIVPETEMFDGQNAIELISSRESPGFSGCRRVGQKLALFHYYRRHPN